MAIEEAIPLKPQHYRHRKEFPEWGSICSAIKAINQQTRPYKTKGFMYNRGKIKRVKETPQKESLPVIHLTGLVCRIHEELKKLNMPGGGGTHF